MLISGLCLGIAATKGTEYLLANPKVQEFIDNAKKRFKKEEPEQEPEIKTTIIPLDLEISTKDISEKAKEIFETVDQVKDEVVDSIKETVEEVKKPAKKRGRKKKYEIPCYEITQAQFTSIEPSFEKEIVWYDDATETFADHTGGTIEYNEAMTLFGADILEPFLSDETRRFLYVRNEPSSIDYEIVKE